MSFIALSLCKGIVAVIPCYNDVAIAGIIFLIVVSLALIAKCAMLRWQKAKNEHEKELEAAKREAEESAKKDESERRKAEKQFEWEQYVNKHDYDLKESINREKSKTKYQLIADFVDKIKNKEGLFDSGLLSQFIEMVNKDYDKKE